MALWPSACWSHQLIKKKSSWSISLKKNIKKSQHKRYDFLFNKIIKNIISNYTPHETVTFDDRNPPWINNNVKQLILEKNQMYKKYVYKNKDPRIFDKAKCLQNEPNSIIASNKQKCYSRLSKKLSGPMTSTKSYWSTLKMFLNNKKIPCIPPLKHRNKYVTDFKEKAEISNSFFDKQCSLMNNSSKIHSIILKRADKFISSISFSINNLAWIIRGLDPSKAYSHDMISIRTLNNCGEFISKLLKIIFKSCTEKGQFPNEWKKANVVPKKVISKCWETTNLSHYLQHVEKIFEHLICNNLYEFFIKNDQISSNQAGFKHVYINFYLLRIKVINRLTAVLKLEVFFFISPKILIKFGTKVLF